MIFPILQIPKPIQQPKKLISSSGFISLNLIELETKKIWTIFAVDGECSYFWCFDKYGNIKEIHHMELTNGKYKILTEYIQEQSK